MAVAATNAARATAQAPGRLTAADLEDFCADLRAKGLNAAVRTGPQQPRPMQPLPAGFDIKAVRAELAMLEAQGPTPSEFAYSGEAATEMAAWADWMHAHRIAGLHFQIAQYEVLQAEKAVA